MNLYNLTDNWLKVQYMFDDEDADIELLQDTLEAIEEPIKDKVENIGKLIRKFESESLAIESEIKRLQDRNSRSKRNAERLKEYVSENLQRASIDKVEGSLFTYSFRKSTSVNVIDESMIPKEYVNEKVVSSVDKKAVGDALKKGVIVAGCELVTKQNLQFK